MNAASTSSEAKLEVDDRLLRYWASGAGMCRDADYNALNSGGVDDCTRRLRAERDAYAEGVRN